MRIDEPPQNRYTAFVQNIRNFCIIAHVDHGKSTLADRFLELTGTVEKRKLRAQMLDQMELEQEKGITIKLAPVRMQYHGYTLNLIDTPGHVDFNYEVSRSLAAVEGAILLVDATQGVQAQTLGNLYLAIEQNLAIIPVVNKIDLPAADVARAKREIVQLVGCDEQGILTVSGKTGEGVDALLQAVIDRIPSPRGNADAPLRALIFDSRFDDYKGVIASVRIVDGAVKRRDKITMMKTGARAEAEEVGIYTPTLKLEETLACGAIGYIATGIKDIGRVRVGDTITAEKAAAVTPLPGYREVKPMVFAGIFPKEGNEYTVLRESMEKLKLNDAALQFEPEHSQALGFGFRCGLLGLLHLEITQERLRREYDMDVIVTVPSVAYRVTNARNETVIIKSPQELPDPSRIKLTEEPWMNVDMVTPAAYVGAVMQLTADRRGRYRTTEYLATGKDQRAILHYEMPLAALIVDFYDALKSATAGYASLNYEFKGFEPTEIVRLDIVVADRPVEELATLVWRDAAYATGKRIVQTLKDTLPRQQFMVKIQAAVGGKIIAADRIASFRKDVTAKLYGGDVTRKNKLLDKQKKGKKRMRTAGEVEIPPEAYLAVLKKKE
ncbi:MAG: translation elongation factor 4 [Patescibacteria group bacterium]